MRVSWAIVLVGLFGGCASEPWPRVERAGAREALVVPWVEMAPAGAGRPIVVIGVVHVAEPAFFAEVRDATSRCATVLVEGVAPRGGDFDTPMRRYERALEELATTLGLAAQHRVLEPRSWWIDADVSEEEFARDVDMNQVLELMARDLVALRAEGSQDRARARFARTLVASSSDDGFAIETRNAAALRAMPATGVGRIGLLYGAHHVPGLVERLRERGYSITRTKWIPVMTYAETSPSVP